MMVNDSRVDDTIMMPVLTPFAPPQSIAMKSKTITVTAFGILLGGLGYGGDAKGQEPEGNPGLENTVTNKLKEAPV